MARRRPGRAYQTAFDMLGVPLDADEEQIRDAYATIQGAHGLDDNQIPAKLRDAFALLSSERSRAAYREVLAACRDGRPISVTAPQQEQFRRTCATWAIRAWEDQFHSDVFYVWEADQPEPAEVTRQREATKAPPGSPGSISFQKLVRRLLAYAATVIVIVAAVVTYRSWSAAAAARLQRELTEAVRADVASADRLLASLEHELGALAQEFRDLTGFDLEAVQPVMQRPRELDLALIRHETARNAWDELLTQRVSPATLAELKSRCESARSDQEAGIVNAATRDATHRLVTDLEGLVQRAMAHRANIRHIREMLEADRLERALNEPEGRSP